MPARATLAMRPPKEGTTLRIAQKGNRSAEEEAQKLDPEDVGEIWRLFQAGTTQQEIADQFKVSHQRIAQIVGAEEKRIAEEAERAAATAAAKAELDGEECGVKLGDFRTVAERLSDGSVHLIFTDPPYGRKSLDLYEGLATVAARVLCEGGSMVTYFPQYLLPEVMARLSGRQFRYWWTLAVIHSGTRARMTEYGIIVGWKPLAWFVKGTRGDKQTFIDDIVFSSQEKERHDWQQSVIEARHCIEALCPPGGLVFDPFCGGGTTAVAAKELGRRWLTCDVDTAAVHRARKRIHDTTV